MTATEQWHASKAIQQEFPTAEIYDAFKRAEAQGRAKITTRLPASFNYPPERKAAIGMTPRVPTYLEQWQNSADLQFEFPTAEIYAAYRKGTRTPAERAAAQDTELEKSYERAQLHGHIK